jgi:ATP-dependent DNA helicase HFM1/MER3
MSFTFRERLEGRDTGSGVRRYPILQPQLTQLPRAQAVPPRDRYRAPRHNVVYDGVEDDGTYGVEQPLGSFSEYLG